MVSRDISAIREKITSLNISRHVKDFYIGGNANCNAGLVLFKKEQPYLDQSWNTPTHLGDGLQDPVVQAHLVEGNRLVVITVAVDRVLDKKSSDEQAVAFSGFHY